MQVSTSAPSTARDQRTNKRTRVKAEPQTNRLSIVHLIKEGEEEPINSDTSDGDVLVLPWMFEKVFLLSRGTPQAGASKKDIATCA